MWTAHDPDSAGAVTGAAVTLWAQTAGTNKQKVVVLVYIMNFQLTYNLYIFEYCMCVFSLCVAIDPLIYF